MKFLAKMVFIGLQEKVSGKTDKTYYLAKLIDENKSVYEIYIPAHKAQVVEDFKSLADFQGVEVGFEVSSFNNKPQIDVVGVKIVK